LAVVIDRSAKFKPALKLARQFDRTRRPFDVLFEGKILIKHSGQLRFVSGYRVDPSIQSRPAVRPVRDSHGERGMFRCAASGFHLDLAKGSFVVVIDAKERPHHLNTLLIQRVSLLNGQKRRRARKRS
jgi:hypothetical protein